MTKNQGSFWPSGMTRRAVVGGASAGGVLALAGCETQPLLQSIGKVGEKVLSTVTGANKDIYREKSNTPAMMERAFKLYQAASSGNLLKTHLQDWGQALETNDQVMQEFKAALNEGKIKEVPDVIEYMGRSLLPVLRAGYNTLALQESLQSKRTMARRLDETVYELPPGTGLRLDYIGRCMDPAKPAPVKGELLELNYIDSRLYETLRPVFKGLCKWYGKTNDPSGQTLTWMVMSAGQPDGLCSQMNQEQFNKLQQVYPNGGQIVLDHHRSQVFLQKTIQRGINKFLPRLAGVNMNNSRQVDRAVESSLNDLIEAGLKDGGSGQPGFTLLDTSLTSRAVGNAVLGVDATVINAGGTTVVVDTLDYEARPRRHRQSVSPVPGKNAPQLLKVATDRENLGKEINTLVTKTTQSVGAWDQLIKLAASKGVEVGAILTKSPADAWITGKLDNKNALIRLLGAGATFLPFVGNSLSLYEVLSGKDWLTGKRLSEAEVLAAAIGTVPGGQVMKGLGKLATASKQPSLVATTGNMLNRLADSGVIKLWDDHRTGYIKDVAIYHVGASKLTYSDVNPTAGWVTSNFTSRISKLP